MSKFLGFAYIAKKQCGRVAAMCWDDPVDTKVIANTVSDYIRRGLTVDRVRRYEGDPQPEWVCDECRGKPCKEPLTSRTGEGG